MITILNGKLTIPEEERFIGFAGDNLARKIEFVLSGITQEDSIYRLYLTFDDGTVNYFRLPSKLIEDGVLLTWNVEQKHIFKSGNVRAQIKAFSETGVIYHTTSDTFFVGNSAEFSDGITEGNTEFLEYEKALNNLMESIKDVSVLMPYVGDNGNWYIYDSQSGEYKDSGKPSVGLADDFEFIEGIIDNETLFSQQMRNLYLSLPLYTKTIAGAPDKNYYNRLTDQGIYRIDSYSGVHEVMLVFKPSSQAYLMQLLLKYNKILYRGIHCTIDGVYADEDWEEWTDLTADKMNTADTFKLVSALGENANPEIIAYQTQDPTTHSMLRIPLSLIKGNNDFVNLGEVIDIKRLDLALSQNNYDKSKVFRFSFANDIYVNDSVIPGTTAYIGYITNSEKYGLTLEFEPIISDGIKRILGFASGIPNVYDYWEEPVIKNDFINAGNFYGISELQEYSFEIGKTYKFYLNKIEGINSTGFYIGVCSKQDAGEPKVLEFSTVLFDGYNYTLNLDDGALSVAKMKNSALPSIEDKGNYFVSETIEGALQELGAEVVGVADLLAQI